MRILYSSDIVNQKTIKFEIVFDYMIGKTIAASVRSDYPDSELDKDIADEIEQDYDAFISMLFRKIESMGFEHLESVHKSSTNSRYFTFCRKSEYEELRVEIVIFLRISDHRLSKYKSGDRKWDRNQATQIYIDNEVNEYRFLNEENPDSIEPISLNIIVNENKFKTYRDALNHIQNRLRKYL